MIIELAGKGRMLSQRRVTHHAMTHGNEAQLLFQNFYQSARYQ